jgi:hypothetical protein
MFALSDLESKVQAEFQSLRKFISAASVEGLRIDEVEREVFRRLLSIGWCLLASFIARAGDGDRGQCVERGGKTLLRSEERKEKPYRSIFGVLSVMRYVYSTGPNKKIEWAPVDAQLGLPASEQSYVLQDWLTRLCVKEAYREAVTSLAELLGIKTSVRAAEVMVRHAAQHTDAFRESRPAPDPRTEGQILVLAMDGKGVPMRRPLEERLREHQATAAESSTAASERTTAVELSGESSTEAQPESDREKKKRLGPGQKRMRKQMAYVGAVYTIDRFSRTAADIVDELRRRKKRADRPQPQNKEVFADLTRFEEGAVINGQDRCFARLTLAAIHRASGKPLVCLMDGQSSFWNLRKAWFPRAVGILDLFHVIERLWQVAHAFHGEGAPAAQAQVDAHLLQILEGKSGYLCGVYKRMLAQHKLRGSRAETVRKTIGYFENNQDYMKYDEYLAAGYPIATGVVEGACRHYVKDRMELAGMRWEIEGAQALLSLRAVHVNEEWDAFQEYRIAAEQQALYGQAA